MSAAAILARADECGVQVHAVGDELKARWSANAPPSRELIAALKANKAAIIATLAMKCDADGWRDYFEERAAIREHDGGMSRADAEAGALADCVARWRALNPLPASGFTSPNFAVFVSAIRCPFVHL
jgi:hypothetical protein